MTDTHSNNACQTAMTYVHWLLTTSMNNKKKNQIKIPFVISIGQEKNAQLT